MKLEIVKVLCPTCGGKGNFPNQQNDSRASVPCETCKSSGWLDQIIVKEVQRIYNL